MSPGALHAPPHDLASRPLDILNFAEAVFRSHSTRHHPVFYGKTGLFRFDAPDGSYGVLYAGTDAHSAFVEGLVSNPENRVLTTSHLKSKALSKLKPRRSLRLIDLTISGALVRIGADARLFSGTRSVAQSWSKALHDHPVTADGILYPSRLDPSRHCVALFGDRAPKLTELDRQAWYAAGPQRDLLATIADHYRIELIEDHLVPPRKPIDDRATPRLPID